MRVLNTLHLKVKLLLQVDTKKEENFYDEIGPRGQSTASCYFTKTSLTRSKPPHEIECNFDETLEKNLQESDVPNFNNRIRWLPWLFPDFLNTRIPGQEL